jgi:hypothetical protein
LCVECGKTLEEKFILSVNDSIKCLREDDWLEKVVWLAADITLVSSLATFFLWELVIHFFDFLIPRSILPRHQRRDNLGLDLNGLADCAPDNAGALLHRLRKVPQKTRILHKCIRFGDKKSTC